jgi:hypothetical protein
MSPLQPPSSSLGDGYDWVPLWDQCAGNGLSAEKRCGFRNFLELLKNAVPIDACRSTNIKTCYRPPGRTVTIVTSREDSGDFGLRPDAKMGGTPSSKSRGFPYGFVWRYGRPSVPGAASRKTAKPRWREAFVLDR